MPSFLSARPRMIDQVRMPTEFALASESIGLETMLLSRLANTSVIPLGGVASAAASVSLRDTGKAKLARTASAAASRVLNMYRKMTMRNCFPMPSVACASELITRTNTRIGAIALRAPTNMVPRTEIAVEPRYSKCKNDADCQSDHDAKNQTETVPFFKNVSHSSPFLCELLCRSLFCVCYFYNILYHITISALLQY